MPEKKLQNLRIDEVEAYCTTCKSTKPFQDKRPTGGLAREPGIKPIESGESYLSFTCVSCGKKHEYLIQQIVSNDTIKIQKYGELPRKPLPRDKELSNFLKKDSDNYEKALACLANGYGIGAFAYLRRIIENNINYLLDLLKEDLECTEQNQELIEAVSKLKIESPMSDKIKIANNALPSYLQPDGLNPLGSLYKILSEGVHSKTDEECLNVSNKIEACLKYLISELSHRKKSRSNLKELFSDLNKD